MSKRSSRDGMTPEQREQFQQTLRSTMPEVRELQARNSELTAEVGTLRHHCKAMKHALAVTLAAVESHSLGEIMEAVEELPADLRREIVERAERMGD